MEVSQDTNGAAGTVGRVSVINMSKCTSCIADHGKPGGREPGWARVGKWIYCTPFLSLKTKRNGRISALRTKVAPLSIIKTT